MLESFQRNLFQFTIRSNFMFFLFSACAPHLNYASVIFSFESLILLVHGRCPM
jgi:hypothetical protein